MKVEPLCVCVVGNVVANPQGLASMDVWSHKKQPAEWRGERYPVQGHTSLVVSGVTFLPSQSRGMRTKGFPPLITGTHWDPH